MGHIHEKYDFTVSGVIVRGGRVLMLFHHKLHIWVAPSGHIELDETPIQALYRETFEETGLSKENLTLISPFSQNMDFDRDSANSAIPIPFDISTHLITETHSHIDFGYILISNTDTVVPEIGGAQDLRWLTIDEIAKLEHVPRDVLARAKFAIDFAKSKHQ